MTKEENKIFLRFYAQNKENIDKCISELKTVSTGIIKTTQQSLKLSCNPINPDGNHIQVWLYFDTKQHENDFYDNPKTREIYMKYATGSSIPYDRTFVKREPGDIAFGVQ